MLSDLGKKYMSLLREGKICDCVYKHGLLCNDCVDRIKNANIISERNKKIKKIFGN